MSVRVTVDWPDGQHDEFDAPVRDGHASFNLESRNNAPMTVHVRFNEEYDDGVALERSNNGNYSCANCGLGVSRTHKRVGCVLTCNECGYESFEPIRDTLVRLEEMINALKAARA